MIYVVALVAMLALIVGWALWMRHRHPLPDPITLTPEYQQLREAFDAFATAIGEQIVPAMREWVAAANKAAEAMRDLPGPVTPRRRR